MSPAASLARSLAALFRPGRPGDVLALAAGGALALAFSPFGLWPLAVLAPALLFGLWLRCSARQAAWRGWLFGVGLWGAGVYWVYHSLHYFGDAIAPLAAAITVAFVLALALVFAILGALVARGDPADRGAAWLLLTAPAGWVALEWVRSWFLTGFPWLLLGTAQTDTWLAGYAPVLGVYGVSLIVALSAGVLAALIRLPLAGRAAALVAVAAVWSGGALVEGRDWSRPAGEPLRVALIQGNIEQGRKFASLEPSIRAYTERTRDVAAEADLVVWPETAIPTFWYHVADRLNQFILELDGTEVVTGIFIYDRAADRYFNAVRPLGPERGSYHKQRLVPFGEYMPLRTWLQPLERVIDIPMSDLAPGDRAQGPLSAAGIGFATLVCYEAAYPGTVRGLARDAGMLINVSNDAWFGDSSAPAQHLQIARMRSLETARPMLRATNTGISALIDHHGRVVEHGPQFEPATVTGELAPREGDTPYMRLGSWPALLAVALMLAVPAVLRRHKGMM